MGNDQIGVHQSKSSLYQVGCQKELWDLSQQSLWLVGFPHWQTKFIQGQVSNRAHRKDPPPRRPIIHRCPQDQFHSGMSSLGFRFSQRRCHCPKFENEGPEMAQMADQTLQDDKLPVVVRAVGSPQKRNQIWFEFDPKRLKVHLQRKGSLDLLP